jgi:hypothetical protein
VRDDASPLLNVMNGSCRDFKASRSSISGPVVGPVVATGVIVIFRMAPKDMWVSLDDGYRNTDYDECYPLNSRVLSATSKVGCADESEERASHEQLNPKTNS